MGNLAHLLRQFQRGGLTVESRNHLTICIATKRNDTTSKLAQASQRLHWHRARDNISPNNDHIRLNTFKFFENSLEGREVPMNIVKSCYFHNRGPFSLKHVMYPQYKDPELWR